MADILHNAPSYWDREYEFDRYDDENPLPFTEIIIHTLSTHGGTDRRGLYIGYRDGRSYKQLAAACTGLRCIDVSEASLRDLLKRHTDVGRMPCEKLLDDYRDVEEEQVDYVVSILPFQHGDNRQTARYLERAATILSPDSLLFLRVNSVGTDVYHQHDMVEGNEHDGFTVKYKTGSRKRLCVRFFGHDELLSMLCQSGFKTLGLEKRLVERGLPKAGPWKRWEVVAVRQ